MSRVVRELDRQVVSEVDHAGGQQLGEVVGVLPRLRGVPASVFGFLDRAPDFAFDVVGVGRVDGLLQPLQRPPATDRLRGDRAEENCESRDEDDGGGIHAASMAQPIEFGSAAKSSWHVGPPDATLSVSLRCPFLGRGR